jgi:SAM-dependent methyltransferase
VNDEWHDDEQFWEAMAPVIFDSARRELTEFEVDGIVDLLDLKANRRVLDLACGLGRHAIEFALRGHDVTAVDRTEAYLERARRRAGLDNLDIEWVREDMRQFRRPDTFDLAVCLYTSFGYFEEPEENQRVLENVADALVNGGRFVVEVAGKESMAADFRPVSWEELDDGSLFLARRRLEGDWEWVHNQWILVTEEHGRRDFQMRHRLYAASELRQMLLEAGFDGVDIYGSFDGAPYDRDARTLVAVAR